MTPQELEKLPKPLERTMTALETSIMAEVVERIKSTMEITPLIDQKINRLSAIGASKSRIRSMIADALRETDARIDEVYRQAVESDYIRHRELYEAAGRDYLPYEENAWLQQVVEAIRQQTKDSLRPMENITQTTGFHVMLGKKRVFTPLSEYLERSLDQAMMGITSGSHTYSQAINEVIQEMTNSGLRMTDTVDYASGRSDRIEVAARRAVMTGVAQLTDQVNEKNAAELGTEHWEVDWHMGARNTGTGYQNHQSWQGKVYDAKGMKTVCGWGEMLGFAGINCYHIRFPFLPGISKRKYTDEWLAEQNQKENEKKAFRGREYDTYGALQYQRKLERMIRKQRQDVKLLEKGGADQDVILAAKSRMRITEQTYVKFSKEMGLAQQRERLMIAKKMPAAKLGAGGSEKGIPGKPQLVGEINIKNTDQAIKYYNEQIRYQEKEHAFIIDRKGNVYYSVGSEDSVNVEGIDLKGATITHNHPASNGILSFGEDDFSFLKTHQDVREMQCVNPEYSYKISLLKDITSVVYHDIYLDGFKYAMEEDYESQDAAMRVLQERGYARYERIKFITSKTEGV